MKILLLSASLIAAGTSVPQDCQKSCDATPKAVLASNSEASDIVDTAVAAGSFKTLAAALGAAGLVDALKGEGPFTVFAPTDEAFAALPEGTIETLLKPENKKTLQAILTYHVVSGDVRAKQVVKLKNATTLNGQRVDIMADDEGVRVDGANVVRADIACSNGVIHVIDKVILPNTDDLLTTATKAGNFNTLGAAIRAAGLVEALKGDGPFTVFAPTDDAFAALPAGTVETLLKPENLDKLHALAQALLEREILDRAEIGAVINGDPLDPVEPEPPKDTPPPKAPVGDPEPRKPILGGPDPLPDPSGA